MQIFFFQILLSFFILACPILNSVSFGEESSNDQTIIKSILNDFKGKAEFVARPQVIIKKGKTVTRIGRSYLTLSATWRDKIKAVITAKLDRIISRNGDTSEFTKFDIRRFIEEAYIEIVDIGGLPVAVAFGKKKMPFGQGITPMPIEDNGPLYSMQNIEDVFGIAISLDEGIFEIFDKLELAVFETGEGDLEIGRVDGVSIRISRAFGERFFATLSAAYKGNRGDDAIKIKDEQRYGLGILYENEAGTIVWSAEGIVFKNNPEFYKSYFGASTNFLYQFIDSASVAIEYNYVQKALHEVGIGFRVFLTKNISVGVEVRRREYIHKMGKSGFIYGADLTFLLGTEPQDLYYTAYLVSYPWDDEEDDVE